MAMGFINPIAIEEADGQDLWTIPLLISLLVDMALGNICCCFTIRCNGCCGFDELSLDFFFFFFFFAKNQMEYSFTAPSLDCKGTKLTRCSMILINPGYFRSGIQGNMLYEIRIAQEFSCDVDDVRLFITQDLLF